MARRWGAFWAEPRPRARRPADKALERRLGRAADPVSASGRKLASTFWGRAWCDNLERYHDYENRLPRGRTYLRQGSVLDLHIAEGKITAVVIGSALYDVRIDIDRVAPGHFSALRKRCAGGLSSVVALLEGRIGDDVMAAVTEPRTGLFPEPSQIRLQCSCPDWATMCKHVAAVLYGVGVRLDREPALLFTLRGVEADSLVGAGVGIATVGAGGVGSELVAGDLSAIFGVTIDDAPPVPAGRATNGEPEHTPPVEWDPDEVAMWTIGELAARGGRSLAEIFAFAVAQEPASASAHEFNRALAAAFEPQLRARKRPRPPAQRPSKADTLEDLVLQTLRAFGGKLTGDKIRVKVGGTPMQVRTALQRLIERGEIQWSGKARATRYWAR